MSNISIHIGQSGCNLGNTLWELYCMENGLGCDGQLLDAKSEYLHHDTTFFARDAVNHFTPRSLFIDTDSVNISSIKSRYSKLYRPDNFIIGNESNAKNTFASAYYTQGRLMLESIMEQLRRVCESCDGRKIFWLFHSMSGGTSSGIASLLLEELNREYQGNSCKFQVALLPDTDTLSSLECYNSTLSFSSCIESADMSFFFSNRKITHILQLDSRTLPYTSINKHISIALSCLTSKSRQSPGEDVNEHIGLKVYPRMHYPLISYYPTSTIHGLNTESSSTKDLTTNCFDNINVVLDLDPSFGWYINTNLFYRGDVLPSDVMRSVEHIGAYVELLDWTPAGLKIFYSDHSRYISPERDLLRIDRSVCMLSQHTIFKEYLKGLSDKFSVTFRKKEFIDLYMKEGMEEIEFVNSKESIDSLIQEFEGLI